MNENIFLSIVCPAYNEEENISEFLKELSEVMQGTGKSYEIVIVNDGSSDGTLDEIRKAQQKYDNLRLVDLARNYGQSTAMQAGFDMARGELVITIDSDRQNDPSDISRMLEIFADNEVDVVSGWRKERKDTPVRKFFSRTANGLISKMTHVKLHDYGCTLKIYRARILKNIRLYGELHRFIPALMAEAGAKVIEVPVNHRARVAGSSKYGLDRTIRVVLDLMLILFLRKFIQRPIQIFGLIGLVILSVGFIINLYLTFLKIFEGQSIGDRPLLLLGTFMIVCGVFFITQGILGELIIRSLHEGGTRKQYYLKLSSDEVRVRDNDGRPN